MTLSTLSTWTSRVACALVLLALAGCAASATFHSKNGAHYPVVAEQAVRCDENEARAVVAAGGAVIGTIDAHALAVNASDEDLADKAMAVAAKNGGTHLVLTEKGVEQFTVYNAAREDTQCTQGQQQDGTTQTNCSTTYTPPSTNTYEKPTAKFIVFRLPREGWAKLPPNLRPVRADD